MSTIIPINNNINIEYETLKKNINTQNKNITHYEKYAHKLFWFKTFFCAILPLISLTNILIIWTAEDIEFKLTERNVGIYSIETSEIKANNHIRSLTNNIIINNNVVNDGYIVIYKYKNLCQETWFFTRETITPHTSKTYYTYNYRSISIAEIFNDPDERCLINKEDFNEEHKDKSNDVIASVKFFYILLSIWGIISLIMFIAHCFYDITLTKEEKKNIELRKRKRELERELKEEIEKNNDNCNDSKSNGLPKTTPVYCNDSKSNGLSKTTPVYCKKSNGLPKTTPVYCQKNNGLIKTNNLKEFKKRKKEIDQEIEKYNTNYKDCKEFKKIMV